MTQSALKNRTITILALLVIALAFASAGSGDYADAKDHENARLKAAAARCQLANSLREYRAPNPERYREQVQ
jgi:hypothetical protein